MNPLVSVIIPVYNQRPDFLIECLDSVVQQKYSNLEIIISDNHSTDSQCINIISEFTRKDGRIKVVKPKAFVPLIDNFNFGFSKSSGEFITFLSSDDLFLDDFISESLKPFSSYSDLAFVYSRTAFFVNVKSNIVKYVRERKEGFYNSTDSFKLFMTGKEGSFCGAMFRRKIYEQTLLMDTRLFFAGDIYIFMHSLKFGAAYYINKTFGLVRYWEREEYSNRIAKHLLDINFIYESIVADPVLAKFVDKKSVIARCKHSHFIPIIYSMNTIWRDNTIQQDTKFCIEQIILKEYQHHFWVQLMLRNKNNLLGKLISKTYWLKTNLATKLKFI